jgi:protein-S-isoprenylcysteine O-methyltransferase Ste14
MFSQLAIPIAIYTSGVVTGFILGWLYHKKVSQNEIENWERSFVVIFVTMGWAISLVFDIAVAGYDTPVAVHGVMGIVVGYFFEGTLKRKKD